MPSIPVLRSRTALSLYTACLLWSGCADDPSGPALGPGQDPAAETEVHLRGQDDVASLAQRRPTPFTVLGDLIVEGDDVASLEGLENLTEVDGVLAMCRCPALRSLPGLQGLRRVGLGLCIQDNAALSTLEGLEALEEVGLDVTVQGNPALTDLQGLRGLRRTGGPLTVEENPRLTQMAGLGAVTSLGGLRIQDNPLLMDIEALGGLDTLGGNLLVLDNPLLPTAQARSLEERLRRWGYRGATQISGNLP
ncbi:MAG: hypothetical protein AB1505_11965 [Candidatus Latescibacterota bacterium]